MIRTVAVLLLGILLAPTAAIAAEVEVLETRGEFVRITTPAPGHSTRWQLGVRAPEEHIENLSITLVAASGTAVSGPEPLLITLEDSSGRVLISGTAEQMLNEVIVLPRSRTGEWSTLHATAALPLEAGDDYRGSRAELQFRFMASHESDSAVQGRLPYTGAAGVIAILVLAFTLILTGLCLLERSSRTGIPSESREQRWSWVTESAENPHDDKEES